MDDDGYGDTYLMKVLIKPLIKNIPEEATIRLIKLLKNFSDVFSCSKQEIRMAKGVYHKIETQEARPVKQQLRRVQENYQSKEKLVAKARKVVKQFLVFDSLSPMESSVEKCLDPEITVSHGKQSTAAVSSDTKNPESQTKNLEEVPSKLSAINHTENLGGSRIDLLRWINGSLSSRIGGKDDGHQTLLMTPNVVDQDSEQRGQPLPKENEAAVTMGSTQPSEDEMFLDLGLGEDDF
ncbi:hypothetical protein HELRODRAFT_164994 [Helobdella robusta]|uniref:Uncharacterized protein n=1 Tax=Helobdella robusta TaxID=6412 RepID=T1EW32_HELRO|nr:hypothetical protein HELRODRAFT_164994 [Helobdella robusta]ESN92862.1 hypothetical protein HELRODRAFT_164994 [Helobdella robusta]